METVYYEVTIRGQKIIISSMTPAQAVDQVLIEYVAVGALSIKEAALEVDRATVTRVTGDVEETPPKHYPFIDFSN